MRLLVFAIVLAITIPGCTTSPATTPADERDVRSPLNTAPRLVTLSLVSREGAEPSIGITTAGTIFTVARDLTMRSRDDGRTWDIVYNFTRELAGRDIHNTRDPMLWVDPTTDRVYTSHLYRGVRNVTDPPVSQLGVSTCTFLAWSDDEGDTWTERDLACLAPYVDHQKIVTGPPPPNARPLAGSQYPSVLYMCYNKLSGRGTGCAVSFDGGTTFAYDVPAANDATSSCSGIAGQPAVRDDGTLVLGMAIECAQLTLFVSEDAGLSWREVAGPPGDHGVEVIDPEVAFGADGTLYTLWRGRDNVPLFARSGDLGEAWEDPWTLPLPPNAVTTMEVMSAGAQGRVAIAYLMTDDAAPGTRPDEVPQESRWNLYFATSENALADLPQFTITPATNDIDPIQIGAICLAGSTCAGARNLLDFYDSAIHPDGHFFVSYTDGCVVCCANDADATSEDSRTRNVGVASLLGWSLYEDESTNINSTPRSDRP